MARHTLRRLFDYAIPYRGRLAWAVVGMVVYAIGSAGLAFLIKPIFDSVLPKQQDVFSVAWAIVGVYLLKGMGSYASSYLMAIGTYGMDIGAITPFLYCFRDREKILYILETICGQRLGSPKRL